MGQSMGAWKIAKEQLILLFLRTIWIGTLIAKNGNILSDGTNEREYLRRKYEM